MKRKKVIYAGLAIIVLLPLWMWFAWLVSPSRKMVVAIVDKSSVTQKGQEHISLIWLLKHLKFHKAVSEAYKANHDYYGFFPLKNGHFNLKGLERFSPDQINQLSNDADLVYYTDTYGVYNNEWYYNDSASRRSGVLYGGMTQNDIQLLSAMKRKHKLIITEFNDIASPTREDIRLQFEKLFALHWTGWTARYFEQLDTATNKELPRWLIDNYRRQHQDKWPFHQSGIAFVSDDGQVVILEKGRDLNNAVPQIKTFLYGQHHFDLPANYKYPFWIDVMTYDENYNHAVAAYNIDVNEKGRRELMANNIPLKFPAVLMHRGKDYQFYYFSGDYCDNPVSIATAYLKGIQAFSWLFYNKDDLLQRKGFFWQYYRPLMTTILDDYYNDNIRGKRR